MKLCFLKYFSTSTNMCGDLTSHEMYNKRVLNLGKLFL